MANNDVHVAVVGYGYWGSKHVRVLSTIPGVDVTVVDYDESRRLDATAAYRSVRTACELDEVLDHVDAVVVATPPGTHAAVGLKALRAGKHVLVEKPLATSVGDAEDIVHEASARDLRLMVAHTFLYNAAVYKLKEIVDCGELGRILYIDSARLSLGRYQRDCDVIWDLVPHDLSILSYLLDELPQSVSVWAHRNVGPQHADVAYLRFAFERSQINAFVHVSWLDPFKLRRATVVGDRKMAVYDDMSDNERIRVYDIGVDPVDPEPHGELHAMPMSYRTGDIVSPYIPFHEPLLAQDSHFVDCVRTGQEPATPGTLGLAIVRVLSAADLANRTGNTIVLSHGRNGSVTTPVLGVMR